MYINVYNVYIYTYKCKHNYVIDRASNNFAFIWKMFCISKILFKLGEYNNIQSNSAYSKENFSKVDTIQNNEHYCQKFYLRLTDKDYFLVIMYWLSKLHTSPMKNFHKKSTFYSSYKKLKEFWEFYSNY